MIYENICIIGLGTLGGFISKSISELETTKKLILIDFDKVENKNIRNSIYTKKHVGMFKTDSLYSIISNISDVDIVTIRKKYSESIIPDCNLIIDCRDFTYDRKSNIDVRVYMSSRYLIIDCRKNVKYKNQHEGIYLTGLTKADLRNASFNFSMLLYNGILSELIKQQMVQKLELDYLDRIISKRLQTNKEINITENNINTDLINLNENISPIIDNNKISDLMVYLGTTDNYTSFKTIKKNSLKNDTDVINSLKSMFSIPSVYNYYLVELKNNCVELIPETGAA